MIKVQSTYKSKTVRGKNTFFPVHWRWTFTVLFAFPFELILFHVFRTIIFILLLLHDNQRLLSHLLNIFSLKFRSSGDFFRRFMLWLARNVKFFCWIKTMLPCTVITSITVYLPRREIGKRYLKILLFGLCRMKMLLIFFQPKLLHLSEHMLELKVMWKWIYRLHFFFFLFMLLLKPYADATWKYRGEPSTTLFKCLHAARRKCVGRRHVSIFYFAKVFSFEWKETKLSFLHICQFINIATTTSIISAERKLGRTKSFLIFPLKFFRASHMCQLS